MRAYRLSLLVLSFFVWFIAGFARADEWRLAVDLSEATVTASRTPEIRAAWATRLAGVESATDASNLIAQLTDAAGTVYASQDAWDTSGSDAIGIFDLNTSTLTNFFHEYEEDGIAYFTLTVWDTSSWRRIVRDRVALRNAPVPPSGPAPADPPPLYLTPFVLLPSNEFHSGWTLFSSDLGQTTYAAPPGGASVTEIADLPTAELVASKVLKPDGAGGVVWGNDATGGAQEITGQHAAELNTAKVLKPDGAGGVAWGNDATGGAQEITGQHAAELNTAKVLKPDGAGGVVWATDADTIVTEIANLPAAELDTAKVLKPNGAGGVTWGTDAGGTVSEIANLPTTEMDTGKILKPNGAGGVSWVTGSGATLAGNMTGNIGLSGYDLTFEQGVNLGLRSMNAGGYNVPGIFLGSGILGLDLWGVAVHAGMSAEPLDGQVLAYNTALDVFAPVTPTGGQSYRWYDSMVMYDTNTLAMFEGHLYAMTNSPGMSGYSPTMYPQYWKQIDGGGSAAAGTLTYSNAWEMSTTYSVGAVVHQDGMLFLYTNYMASMGNNPKTSPGYWKSLGAAWLNGWDGMAYYADGSIVSYNGKAYLQTNSSSYMSGFDPVSHPECWLVLGGSGGGAGGAVYEVIGIDGVDMADGSNVTIRAGSYASSLYYGVPGKVLIQGGTNTGMGSAQTRHGDIEIRTVGADHLGGPAMGGNGGDITIQTGIGGSMGGTNGALRCIAGYQAGMNDGHLARFVFGSPDESVANGGMGSDGYTMRVGVGGAQIEFGMGGVGSGDGWVRIVRGSGDTILTFTNSTIFIDGNEVYTGTPGAGQTPIFHKGFCIGVTP